MEEGEEEEEGGREEVEAKDGYGVLAVGYKDSCLWISRPGNCALVPTVVPRGGRRRRKY